MYRGLRYLRQRLQDTGDRGSVALWLLIFTLAVFMLLAFLVDGGQYMNARERALDIADQAARAGVNQVPAQSLRAGTFTLDQTKACAAARELITTYAKDTLSASDQAGTAIGPCRVTYPAPLRGHPLVPVVTVTVDVAVTPVIPVIFPKFTAGATGSATLDCGNAVAQAQGGC